MQYDELKTYLTGLTKEMPAPFYHLAEILQYDALELCQDSRNGDYLIPYMMNDALEYYLILKNSRKTGELQKEEKICSARIIKEDRYILILRQESGNTCTLMFQELEEHARCYQYHRIGHYWITGQEHWRRLVYMVGTIYDKYEFFQDRFCNEKEKELMHLMEFAPFRYWSPVSESLDGHYSSTEEGLNLMIRLAQEAEDRQYLRLLRWYRYCRIKAAAVYLANTLLQPKHKKLYELINGKVQEASLYYPEREYTAKIQKEMQKMRIAAEQEIKKRGYQGTYPHFYKENEIVLMTEEHPFTIMEWEDYTFRIHFLHEQDGKISVEKFDAAMD